MRAPWWVAAALLATGCESSPTSDGTQYWQTRWAIDRRRFEVIQLVTLRDQLDSVPRIVQSLGDRSDLVVLGADRFPEERARVEAAARELWALGAPSGTPIRAGIVLYRPAKEVADTASRWGGFVGTVLPDRTDGRTCLALVSTGSAPTRLGLTRDWVGRLLAPCVYWARFGRPGRGMAQWLEATGWSGGSDLRWLTQRHARLPILWSDDPGWRGIEALVDAGRFQWETVPAVLGLSRVGDRPPYFEGGATVGCLAGRIERCLAAVSSEEPAPMTNVAPKRPSSEFALITPSEWISELIRWHGEDRFRSFWRSDADLPTAFGSVYGREPGSVVLEAARRDWERRLEHQPVVLGADWSVGGLLGALGWGLLFLLLPLVSAGRRRIGQ